MASPKSSRVARVLSWKYFVTILALIAVGAAGCASFEVKERELTFRVVRDTPSWFTGMPAGVQELDLAVSAEGRPQQIHAWWWPAADPGAPAVLYLHGSRWDLTGQLFRIEQVHALRIFSAGDRLSWLRQEQRRIAVRGHGLRRRRDRVGTLRDPAARPREAIHLRTFAGWRRRHRPRGASQSNRHLREARCPRAG